MKQQKTLFAAGSPVVVSVSTPLHAAFTSYPLTLLACMNRAPSTPVLWLIETSQDGVYWEPACDEILVPASSQRSWQTDPENLRRYFRDSARTASGSALVDGCVEVGS